VVTAPKTVPSGGRWWIESLGVIVVLVVMIVPALPPGPWEGIQRLVTMLLGPIGVRQTWSMYAPEPARAFSVMHLTAIEPGGHRRVLEEHPDAQTWTPRWHGSRPRLELWRARVVTHLEVPLDARTRYLESVCVRESRTGTAPLRIVMDIERRPMRSPEEVRRGSEILGPASREHVTSFDCSAPRVLALIAADRARLGRDAR